MKRYLLSMLLALVPVFVSAQQWAVVNTSVSYLRARPDYESGLETQCLMGTVLQVTDSDRYWRKVDAPNYRGCWTNDLTLHYFNNQEERDAYIDAPKLICTAEYSRLYSAPSFSAERISDLIMGDILLQSTAADAPRGWTPVRLPSGTPAWVPGGDVSDLDTWLNTRQATQESIVATARQFLGIPYMWGGNTVKGFDCSGLSSFVYMMNGIVLPRNAREQIHTGTEVPFDFDQMQPGDLVFFGTTKPDGSPAAVTHVGIYTGDGRMIHSSQIVRINSLRDSEPDSYGRIPIAIRRVLDSVGTGKGIQSAASHPWYYKEQ